VNKRELSQLNFLESEIKQLKKRIEWAENYGNPPIATDSVKGSSPHFPYTEHTIMITGIDYSKHNGAVKKLKKEYQNKLDELASILEETFKYIYSLPNSEMRQILTLRYIDKLSWQKVAESMGLEGDGSTQRKKHDKFIKLS